MATLTVQTITRLGLTPAYSAAAGGGDQFLPSDQTLVHIKNGGGGSITASVVTPGSFYDIPIAESTITIGAGAEKMFGPLPAPTFADPTDGLADLQYSGVTSVTVGVFTLKQP